MQIPPAECWDLQLKASVESFEFVWQAIRGAVPA